MKSIYQIGAFFCVLFLCQSAQATLLYSQDWQGATAPLLRTGLQDYNYWAQNPSKTCRVDNTIQLTVE